MSHLLRCSSFALLAFAACGGGSSSPKNPSNETGDGSAAAEPAGGSIGVKDLHWGSTEAEVKAAYPQATANPDGGLWSTGSPDGIEGITSFKLGANGLEEVHIEWTAGFPTMDDCIATWTKVRGAYDTKYAVASQSDNGAAYWKTATVDVTLACNPNDSGAGVLTAAIVPAAAE